VAVLLSGLIVGLTHGYTLALNISALAILSGLAMCYLVLPSPTYPKLKSATRLALVSFFALGVFYWFTTGGWQTFWPWTLFAYITALVIFEHRSALEMHSRLISLGFAKNVAARAISLRFAELFNFFFLIGLLSYISFNLNGIFFE